MKASEQQGSRGGRLLAGLQAVFRFAVGQTSPSPEAGSGSKRKRAMAPGMVSVAAPPAASKENKTPAAKRAAGAQSMMTQSTRKRAKGASTVVAAAPAQAGAEGEAEDGEELVPRVLEARFGSDGEVPTVAPACAETSVAKPKTGLATLFSPVYNLFAGGEAGAAAGALGEQGAGARELSVACSTEEELEAEQETAELAVAVAAAAAAAAAEESDEEEDFDPFLFISNLPPLHRCVPPGRQPVLPRKARRSPVNTLVLDLDETLVHSTLEALAASDFSFPVHFNNQQHLVNVRRRPQLETFMERVGELFEVVIFTASQRVYAEQLLNIIDPGARVFRHRIFRDSCVFVDGNYLKDLTVLGRDLARTIIVDNSPQAFGFQLENGIPIESWFDDPEDRELAGLLPFLEQLAEVDDVRPHIQARFGLKEKVLAHSARGAKLRY